MDSTKAATGAKVERQRGEENSRNKERANHPLELIRKVVARVVVVPALLPQMLGLAVALGGLGLVGGPVYYALSLKLVPFVYLNQESRKGGEGEREREDGMGALRGERERKKAGDGGIKQEEEEEEEEGWIAKYRRWESLRIRRLRRGPGASARASARWR
jgi:hypothetical protein